MHHSWLKSHKRELSIRFFAMNFKIPRGGNSSKIQIQPFHSCLQKYSGKNNNLDITLLNEKLSDPKMVGKQKASGGEAEPGAGNDTASALGLHVLDALLPYHLGLSLVLHHRPNPLIVRPRVVEHHHRAHLAVGASPGFLDEEPRGQAQEELPSSHRKRFLVGGGVVGAAG